ncbi:MAG: 4a-hydroxytetrahydrobiopterin dehydratase [Arenicella sp.]|jgi:4a-hydroxytetrahydrobiopterin dehydratase
MNDDINILLEGQCRVYSSKEGTMNLSQIEERRRLTPLWQFCANDNVLSRVFHFDSYAETIKFVNLVAEVAETQDHHPDLLVTYRRCKVCYKTHTVNGITENEFICAANIDALHR